MSNFKASGANRVFLLGTISGNPSMEQNEGLGVRECVLTVITSQDQVDSDGVVRPRSDYHRVLVRGEQGKDCRRYLKGGDLVYVEGYLQTASFEDTMYFKIRRAAEIVAETVRFFVGLRGGSVQVVKDSLAAEGLKKPPVSQVFAPPEPHSGRDVGEPMTMECTQCGNTYNYDKKSSWGDSCCIYCAGEF